MDGRTTTPHAPIPVRDWQHGDSYWAEQPPRQFGSVPPMQPRQWDQPQAVVPGNWPQPQPAPHFQPPANYQPYPPQRVNGIAPPVFGPYGPAGYVPPGAQRKSRWMLYTGALTVLVTAVVLITGFVAPGFFLTKQLDVAKTQTAVQQLLSDPSGYGAKNVSDVTCNDGKNPTIAKGSTFTCQATISHIKQLFVVTFTDDDGNYQVSSPKGEPVSKGQQI